MKNLDAEKVNSSDIIFGLDIGTRSVIGIVGVKDGENLRIVASKRIEHEKRAMADGQIEDIAKVRKVVNAVKDQLSEMTGLTLSEVSVAAAGRALKVEISKIVKNFETRTEITPAIMEKLKAEAVDKAVEGLYEKLGENEKKLSFYCVGSSIIHKTLDGYEFDNLSEHKGLTVSVEVIVTFLPSSVVESLYSVVEGSKTEISHMTLEPIAAMNALVPKELRGLNIALVDIGAGTSDIAVSKDGTVLSYEMVTTAGDEITDGIVSSLLVDFDTAERLKRALSLNEDKLTYEDILKFSHEISREEMLKVIDPSVEKMCDEICTTILKVNTNSPAAVFLVGGGSQIPDLAKRVAKKLAMPENKVALGMAPYARELVMEAEEIKGPEYMTPLGIVITSFSEDKLAVGSVAVNGEKVKIFEDKNLTVGSVLISKGIALHTLVGTKGENLTFYADGEMKTLRGTISKPAVVTLNGVNASVSTPCRASDVIELIPPQNGEKAKVTIKEYFCLDPKNFAAVNGEKKRIGLVVLNDWGILSDDYIINEGDRLYLKEINTLSDAAESFDEVNEMFVLNGLPTSKNHILSPDDEVEIIKKESYIQKEKKKSGEEKAKVLNVVVNGRRIEIPYHSDNTPIIFTEALNYVDFDLSKPQGLPVIRLNGREAAYADVLSENDNIEIKIEKE